MPRSPARWIAAGLAATAALALPPVVVERHVTLTIAVLVVEGGESAPIGEPVALEVGSDAEEKATLYVPWGKGGVNASVRLGVRLQSSGSSPVVCTAAVDVPGKPATRAERRLEEEGTAFFEVLDDGGRRIVLAVRTEPLDRPVVKRFARVGEPVRFVVVVERVDGDRIVPLETNHLNTFVGQSVTYSFRLGRDDGREDVRLDLLPLSLSGGLLTLQAGIYGALPGSGVTSVLSRQERIVASRLATSTVSATAGTPPSGYRFQVTPDF